MIDDDLPIKHGDEDGNPEAKMVIFLEKTPGNCGFCLQKRRFQQASYGDLIMDTWYFTITNVCAGWCFGT